MMHRLVENLFPLTTGRDSFPWHIVQMGARASWCTSYAK